MAVNSKKKGNRVELQMAKILTDRFGQTFKRVPMSGAFGTINAHENIREDVKEILSGDLICPTGFRFSVEVKSRLDFNFWDLIADETVNEIDDWIKQAENDAKISNKEPLIIFKANNRKPFVLFPKRMKKGKLTYGDYTILRLDYFLAIRDQFFWRE
jgi:hypothetical protein